MVKDATSRTLKAQAKIDPDIARLRIVNYGAQMKINVQDGQSTVFGVQNDVRGYLNTYGVSSIFTVPFMAFALELKSLSTKFAGGTFTSEAAICLAKWKARVTTGGELPDAFEGVLKLICAKFSVEYT